MKIAVVGCGALGCFYGARLCQAGQDVHLLLRSDYEMVRDEGLRIRSADGELRVHPYAHNAPEGIDKCDLVVVGLKTTANDRFAELIDSAGFSQVMYRNLSGGIAAIHSGWRT